MSELESVWVRHAGWILKIAVDAEDHLGNLITQIDPRSGIRAVCMPDGRADVSKFKHDGTEQYQGFGMWNMTKIEPGVWIKIRRGVRIWNVATSRYLILDSAISVRADETEEMEYIFRYQLETYTVGMEEIE